MHVVKRHICKERKRLASWRGGEVLVDERFETSLLTSSQIEHNTHRSVTRREEEDRRAYVQQGPVAYCVVWNNRSQIRLPNKHIYIYICGIIAYVYIYISHRLPHRARCYTCRSPSLQTHRTQEEEERVAEQVAPVETARTLLPR
jgi:hypothetical protein